MHAHTQNIHLIYIMWCCKPFISSNLAFQDALQGIPGSKDEKNGSHLQTAGMRKFCDHGLQRANSTWKRSFRRLRCVRVLNLNITHRNNLDIPLLHNFCWFHTVILKTHVEPKNCRKVMLLEYATSLCTDKINHYHPKNIHILLALL